MKKSVLIVQSNPVAGRDEEYNNWYTNRHLADVLNVPGFISAQRFKLAQSDHSAQWKYLAIYEFEADDPTKTLALLMSHAGTSDMVMSEALDIQHLSAVPWVAISEKLTTSS